MQASPETSAEEAKEESTPENPQPAAEPPQTPDTPFTEDAVPDTGNGTSETSPESPKEVPPEEEALPEPEATPEDEEEPSTDSSANPEPVSEEKPCTETADSNAEEVQEEAAAVAELCPASTSPESAGSDDLSQPPTCSNGNTEVLHSTQFPFCHYTVGTRP